MRHQLLCYFFTQLFGLNGSLVQIAIAHITFCISYVAITVRARAANLNPQLEEAARDLGASAALVLRSGHVSLAAPGARDRGRGDARVRAVL